MALLDFSLSHISAENIRCGTTAYLDPFLRLRKPIRWDLQAERFAVGMTLYEMATGDLSTRGDGKSDPAAWSASALTEMDPPVLTKMKPLAENPFPFPSSCSNGLGWLNVNELVVFGSGIVFC